MCFRYYKPGREREALRQRVIEGCCEMKETYREVASEWEGTDDELWRNFEPYYGRNLRFSPPFARAYKKAYIRSSRRQKAILKDGQKIT